MLASYRSGLPRFTILALAVFGFGSAQAQVFTTGETTHSLQNTNYSISSGVDIGIDSTSDFYINAINVVGGGSWDPGFQVYFNGSYFDNNSFTSGSYSLGDVISGTQNWFFGGFFGGMFGLSFNAPVALGTYSSTFEILGGATNSDMNVLHSFTETIEVVDFGLGLSTPDTDVDLAPGGSTVIRHNLQNNGSRSFLLSSRYMSWSMSGYDQFDFDFSDGYPTVIDPADNLTNVNHLDVTAHPDFANEFTFRSGIIGGYYGDDAVWLEVGTHTLRPVPEPATLIALGMGALTLARRRRKA